LVGAVIGLCERIERKGQLWVEGNPFNPLWKSVDSDPLSENPLTALAESEGGIVEVGHCHRIPGNGLNGRATLDEESVQSVLEIR
jgi:hypothetical protein